MSATSEFAVDFELERLRTENRVRREQTAAIEPRLVFFYSSASGRCRRVEGFLAQVLQRRRNHGTFRMYRVERDERPDLVERFGVKTVPALAVLEGKRLRGRLEGPKGCLEIEEFLAPWLR